MTRVWFDPEATDGKVWRVKHWGQPTESHADWQTALRPSILMIRTSHEPEGHAECEPDRPRGILIVEYDS